MPDPTRATISATQAPALFGVSPYYTRWMLWHHFANGMDIDAKEDARMSWGKKLQPLLLEHAAGELKLEVRPNATDDYVRNGLLGCTRDAEIICPDRGPGALETKCVFDYGVWMRDWDGGNAVPKHHEIQCQQQIAIGDGRKPFAWGMIAAWVCGEMHYFAREPIPLLHARLHDEAAGFFAEVKSGREPDPFGAPIELPWMRDLFPTTPGKVIAGTDDLAALAVAYRDAKDQQSAGERTADPLKAQLLAFAKDANRIDCPNGTQVKITTSGPYKGKRITVYVPETAGRISMVEAISAG